MSRDSAEATLSATVVAFIRQRTDLYQVLSRASDFSIVRRCFHPATHGSLLSPAALRPAPIRRVVAFIRQRTDLYQSARSPSKRVGRYSWSLLSSGNARISTIHGGVRVATRRSVVAFIRQRTDPYRGRAGEAQRLLPTVVAFIRQRTDLYHNGKSHEHTNPIVVAFIRQRTDLYAAWCSSATAGGPVD